MTPASETLLSMAINTYNQVLRQHRDDYPCHEIMETASQRMEGEKLLVAVSASGTESDEQADVYEVQFRSGLLEVVDSGGDPSKAVWRVSPAYLERIAAKPQEFVENPSRLEWTWLLDGLGIRHAT